MSWGHEYLNRNFWKDKRVLVTGATGLVGSWLIKDLCACGSEVVAFIRDMDPQSELFRSGDQQKISIINGQLEDFLAIERAINAYQTDTIFHLGAQAIVGVANRSPLSTFEANIRGTYNLLEACRRHDDIVQRIVIASSDKAYGSQPILPYTEDMPLQGQYPYEVSKSCVDLIAQSYFHSYALAVTVARCGNIYGGGDLNWGRIVPDTIRSCFMGNAPIIRSDGSYIRDYIYIKDVVQAYMRLGECLTDERVKGEAFNFSNEKPLTVMELVGHIQRHMNCGHLKPQILNTVKSEIHSQYLSAAKSKEILSWKPRFDLAQGLLETIAWYRSFLTKKWWSSNK